MLAYPNPFTSFIEFAVKGGSAVSVYDVLGQLVYHSIVESDSDACSIDLGFLQNGMYVLQVSKSGMVHQVKVIKN